MNLLKKWSCYWWIIVRVTSPVLWRDRSSHRGTSARRNFCTIHNPDLSNHRRDPVWCSQMAYKIRIAFRRRESDREMHTKGISRLQTTNGRTEHMVIFSGTRIWVWYNNWPRSTFIQREKAETKCRLVFRELWSIDFPLDQLSSRRQRQNAQFDWINKQEARIKWFGLNGCRFHWSGPEIWSCVRKQKSGIVAVFTV
jgi:hypothetical protein